MSRKNGGGFEVQGGAELPGACAYCEFPGKLSSVHTITVLNHAQIVQKQLRTVDHHPHLQEKGRSTSDTPTSEGLAQVFASFEAPVIHILHIIPSGPSVHLHSKS